jgi:hypothetical protein
MKRTLEEAASKLCEGGAVPEWVIKRLRQIQPLLRFRPEFPDDDDMERLCFESALHLQRLLPHYVKVYEMVGEEHPVCIDDVLTNLAELIPILAESVKLPKRGKPRDNGRHLCAAVCAEIWKEFHGQSQPHSPNLWAACEAYWIACDRPAYSSGHIKNWEDFLIDKNPLIAPK